MPRLDSQTQEAAAAADAWGNEPIGSLLEEGWYAVSLSEVTVIGGDNGRWDWVFTDYRDYDMQAREVGKPHAGRGWWTTTTTPESIGKLRATFEAFDATLDTDTDQLLGEDVLVYVVQETARQGKRKGEIVNKISAIKLIPDGDDEPPF